MFPFFLGFEFSTLWVLWIFIRGSLISQFFYNCDAKREIKDRAGPYGEFFEKVLDVGQSY